MSIKKQIKWQIRKFLIDHYPKMIIDHEWPGQFGRKIDWKNPRDINEKIQWLMCYSDINEWARLADKYRVREFVKERGLEHLLVKLYGVWDNAQKIDYDSLPDKFVLKCNHDSGSVYVIEKSNGFSKHKINEELNQKLKCKFGYVGCEPHYNLIEPRVLAEEFIGSDNSFVGLIDYKIWCFNGNPYCIMTCHSREPGSVALDLYDLNWNYLPDKLVFSDIHKDGKNSVSKPNCLKEMLECASILSKGFSQVRVDFYIVNDKIYFGEMTFSSYAGRMEYYTEDYLRELGDQIKLPSRC